MPLPIDRVIVGTGAHFPSAGRVDVYGAYPAPESSGGADSSQLVIITLGLRDGERDLEPAELMGALVNRIAEVMAERYPRHTPGPARQAAQAAPQVRPADRASQVRSTVIASAPTSGSARAAPTQGELTTLNETVGMSSTDDDDQMTVFEDSPQLALSSNNVAR